MDVLIFSRNHTYSEGEIAGVFIAQGFSAFGCEDVWKEEWAEVSAWPWLPGGPAFSYLCLSSNKITLLDIVAFVFK